MCLIWKEMQHDWDELQTYTPYFLVWGSSAATGKHSSRQWGEGSDKEMVDWQKFIILKLKWRSDFLEIRKNLHSGCDVSFAALLFHSFQCQRIKRPYMFRCQQAARASPGLRSLLNSFGFFSLAHTYRVSWSSGTDVDLFFESTQWLSITWVMSIIWGTKTVRLPSSHFLRSSDWILQPEKSGSLGIIS